MVRSLGRANGPAVALLLAALSWSCIAQAVEAVVPNFWDPRSRFDRPDPATLRPLRILTDDEFPPLHFADADGVPTGFSVELARAVCERLQITCTVQTRRFDTLADALASGGGDVLAAAVPLTPDIRRRFTATTPYHRAPARFAARLDRELPPAAAGTITGRSVGVVSASAHEAYLRSFFPGAEVRALPNLPAAQAALRRGEIDYLFADGLALALWIGGLESQGCCALSGGAYLESRYFGEGVAFLFRREDDAARRAFDYALQRLWDEGRYADLYLRFFPVGLY